MHKVPRKFDRPRARLTCVPAVSRARSVAPADVVAGRHHHAVGRVTVEVGERAQRRRVVAEDDLRVVRCTGLVELRAPRGRPGDAQSVAAHRRHGDVLWTARH